MKLVFDKAGKKLIEMGLLPSRTIAYAVVSKVNEAVRLTTETYLTDKEYRKFLCVMAENRKPAKVHLHGSEGIPSKLKRG
jgi:hypothetical protein